MTDANLYAMVALAGLAALGMVLAAGLIAWRGWLRLKHRQLALGAEGSAAAPSAGARIEIADLKERIRKLEALAAGVEL